MSFKAKRGIAAAIAIWAIGSILIVISITLGVANILHFYENIWLIFMLWIISILCLLIGITMFMVWQTLYYEVSEDSIIIHQSPLRNKRIRFHQIESITKANTVLAGPALSLKNRLIILHNGGTCTVISPENFDEFVALIKKSSPTIQFHI
ncbi:hypothetical protein E4665_15930 [Sporolactobacillus shoreae]|uniref:Uncharacterized protein YyaB-like PH domain-containing protein n=1 Tax=Sporolactobacillus shoreae TaxID=1465501 RepID=A0A4Z0GHZ6_9BACL|nr:PH domain-containing protein [Sporolactobacillus shoreae]TGA96352.1 hypothetical protein E4665_15930 [Sporolactobacillus shoreae]